MIKNDDHYDGEGHFDSDGNIKYVGNQPKENVNDYLAYSFVDISHDGDNGIVIYIIKKKINVAGKPEKFSINFNIEKLIPFQDSNATRFDINAVDAFVAIVEGKEFDLNVLEQYHTKLKHNIEIFRRGGRPVIGEGTGLIRRP